MIGFDLDVAAIATMTSAELRRAWEQAHHAAVPTIAPSLLARDLAHRAQLIASGGINRRLERRLLELADQYENEGRLATSPRPRLGGGSQLLREWGGQTHRVTVEPDGSFLYDGQSWRSLSAIARAITGARWSGPRFFGTGS